MFCLDSKGATRSGPRAERVPEKVKAWPFILTNGTTEEYARRRIHDHLNCCHDLLEQLEHGQIDESRLESWKKWILSSPISTTDYLFR